MARPSGASGVRGNKKWRRGPATQDIQARTPPGVDVWGNDVGGLPDASAEGPGWGRHLLMCEP
ncbi:MAG TPA: hypothetical protein VED59_05830, partial [Acidimicrobiales bacterium]|nr:hypothetical protein [Acidimicrobiales bacterium]